MKFVCFQSRETYLAFLAKRKVLNQQVRGETLPFVAVIGQLYNEGIVAENASEADPDYYDNNVSIILYINQDLSFELDSKILLEAIDSLFKICIVLKVDFAPECGNIWSFFKEFIYCIESKSCSKYTTVISFVKKHLIATIKSLNDQRQMDVEESNSD